jgi:hypothetical protein
MTSHRISEDIFRFSKNYLLSISLASSLSE